jgi:group I intron endonuclease
MSELIESPSDCGIYRIRNIDNGKFYIGSSKRISRRFYLHKWELRRGDHHSILLQRAWDLHGAEKFVFEIIRFCQEGELLSLEQSMLDKLRPHNPIIGYNISTNANRPADIEWSDERRKQASEIRIGRPIFRNNPEAMARLKAGLHRGESHHMFGRHHTEESKKKMSESQKGKPAPNKGKPSPFKGIPCSAERSANISAGKQKYTPSISKLTPEKVVEIRKLKVDFGYSDRKIAALFGVGQCAIWKIISGKSWAHVA